MGDDEKGRGRNAPSHNTAGLAGSPPTPGPIDQIFTEQLADSKGSGASAGLPVDAACDSGNSCTLGNDPASSQLGSAGPRPHCKPAHAIWTANCP